MLYMHGSKPSCLGKRMLLSDAEEAVMDYIRTHGADEHVDDHAAWRRHPADDEQLEILQRLGARTWSNMTAGEAGDQIALSVARRRR